MNVIAVWLLITAVVAQVSPPTFAALANRTYDFGPDDDRRVTLEDGVARHADEGTAFELMATHAIGDLDGDRRADAAVILTETSSGTGRFSYLFVFLSRDGELAQLGPPEWLGDRSVIERVTIDRRRVLSVRFLTHRDRDPACCPTWRVDNRYRIVNGKLVGEGDPKLRDRDYNSS